MDKNLEALFGCVNQENLVRYLGIIVLVNGYVFSDRTCESVKKEMDKIESSPSKTKVLELLGKINEKIASAKIDKEGGKKPFKPLYSR